MGELRGEGNGNWSPKWRSLGRSLKTPPKRSLGRTWYRKLISKDSSNHWSCGDRVWRCSDIANVSIWPTFLVFCSCVHVMDNGFSLKLMIGCLYALLHLNEIWLFLPAVTLVLTCCDMVAWYYINISIMFMNHDIMHVVFPFVPGPVGRQQCQPNMMSKLRIGRSSYALLPRRAVLCCSLTMIQPESQGQNIWKTAPWMKTAVVYFGSVVIKLTQRKVRWIGKSEPLRHENFARTPHLYAICTRTTLWWRKTQGSPHWLDSKIKSYSSGMRFSYWLKLLPFIP